MRDVAVGVFSHLGDYGRILPSWLLHDGVLTHIAEEQGRAVGYTMLGFYPLSDGSNGVVADLLAIAVATDAQGRGIGKLLLEHAVKHVQTAQRRMKVREVRLSVADSNLRARRLFQQLDFKLVPGEHGFYDGGQVALHMSRKL